ncbi:hypothetical protein [Myxococcus sp. Y35]|uniref:hypothetical protein n=1 Tax=Pseudomyxococcus flavus TaxID=3115648 RepID=UPI003CF69E9A
MGCRGILHAANHQSTDHAIVDLHQERPSFFPSTTILWASPECTKWSQANGSKLPDIEEGLFEDPLSDEAKTRSRLLMFDVLRFIEHHRYRLVIVENVVDIAINAKYRTAWKYRTDRSPVEGVWLVKRGQEGPLEGDARAVRRAGAEAVPPLGAHAGPSGPARRQAAGAWASR